MNTVKEPRSAVAYEMEINVIGTGMGIFKYLETADPSHRERVAKDHADFVRFKAEYDRLAETPRGMEMGSEVGRLYQAYHSLGDSLMAKQGYPGCLVRPYQRELRDVRRHSRRANPG